MNLLQVRTQFAKLSGRYDLVNDDFTDNGADYFLKSALKFLDREVGFDKEVVREVTAVEIGDYLVDTVSRRVVHGVFWKNSAGVMKQLEYLSGFEVRGTYGDYTDLDNATPTHYALVVDTTQLAAQQLVILPPPEAAGNAEVWFSRETPFPSEDVGTNFWYSNFEHIAVNASLMMLEASYRNTQGYKDWLATIRVDLLGIEKDTVESDATLVEEMTG
jgi:hypothetical protein